VYATEASMLRRCVNNLVSNGIRYGGRAHIKLSDSPTMLLITIRDYGPGMAEADLERVFEPFVRLEPSRNRNSGGSGIGLAISRNIARWHGGDVKLHNAPDKVGLIAEISLPRMKTSPAGRSWRADPAVSTSAKAIAPGPAVPKAAGAAGAAGAGAAGASGARPGQATVSGPVAH
jgi:hypothetical protein